ncbi:MAG TPA: hypothetical protein PLV22_04715 [Candidatus Cloacimonadota bacterium]|nr:hypothetical protein [Candidatus Cloacimonadota bacterium]HOQ79630.1 hypothetical protein [Candidatus Cloacimonadota bacterium]
MAKYSVTILQRKKGATGGGTVRIISTQAESDSSAIEIAKSKYPNDDVIIRSVKKTGN